MTSLLDIGPLTAEVEIRGKKLTVKGVTAKTLLLLLQEFPELRKLLAQGSGKAAVTPEMLIAQVPGALSSLIVAACGLPMSKENIGAADNLSIGEQGELIVKIWELTFPRGVSSFTDALRELSRYAGFGWDPVTPSPEQSKSSSPEDTEKSASGNTPPA